MSSAPRLAACMAGSTKFSVRGSSGWFSLSATRLPMTTVSMLLKSWARPPVSWPMASIFWAWARAAWVRRCSVTSMECT